MTKDKTPEDDRRYHQALYDLQVELVKLQRQLIADRARVSRRERTASSGPRDSSFGARPFFLLCRNSG